MSYRAFWQRRCRAAAAGAVLKPQGGNCAVLPQDKMVHIGGSSGIAVFSGFLVYTLRGIWKQRKWRIFRKHKQDVRQRAAGILCGFQGFLTHNPAVFVEIEDIFDFSDPPWSKTHKCSLYSFQCFYFTVRYIGSISDPTEILFKPFFNRWPPKVSPVNHIEGGCKSISPYGMIISNSFTSRSTRGHSPQNLPEWWQQTPGKGCGS